MYLNGATLNRIDFNTTGTAVPAFTTRSAGTKIVLYPAISATNTDIGFGVAFPAGVGELWCSVDSASNRTFVWYGGSTEWMRLAANGSGSGALRINPGVVTIPAYSTTSDTNTGIYFPAADTIGFVEGGTEVMRIHDSGRVTIGGTTTPTYNLEVQGSDMTVNSVRVGRGAGSISTNVILGPSALNANTTGANNIAIGQNSLLLNTTGSDNIAIGSASLDALTTGAKNVAIGSGALGASDKDDNNVAIGHNALLVSQAPNNVAIGSQSLDANTTGTPNLAVGVNSLGANTTGADNIAIGHQALDANTTGTKNLAIGTDALGANSTASNNIGIGFNALLLNTTGENNIAIGSASLDANTTGARNLAVGGRSLTANTTGDDNVAIGYDSLLANTTGARNIAVGNYSLDANTTGQGNVAIGQTALGLNTTGSENVAIGDGALSNNTSGNNNVGVGKGAIRSVTTGLSNVGIGDINIGNALTTGNYNILIGQSVDVSASGSTQQIVIGRALTGIADNTAYIGGSNGAYNELNDSSWMTTSDLRLKKNVVDNSEGLSIINQIRVRNFEYKSIEEITEVPTTRAIKQTGVQLGVIAQELQSVLPASVTVTSDGVLSVNTSRLIWHLVNSVKELTARIETLENSGSNNP